MESIQLTKRCDGDIYQDSDWLTGQQRKPGLAAQCAANSRWRCDSRDQGINSYDFLEFTTVTVSPKNLQFCNSMLELEVEADTSTNGILYG